MRMKNHTRWKFCFKVVFGCLFVGLAIFAFTYWFPCGLTNVDITYGTFWTAASAIGTFSAAFVALWISSENSSEQRKKELQAARICAARISSRLSRVSEDLSLAMGGYEFYDLEAEGDEQIRAFEVIYLWLNRKRYQPSTAELIALAPVSDTCAPRIARAFDLLSDLQEVLNNNWSDHEFRKLDGKRRWEFLKAWSHTVHEAKDFLNVSASECETFASSGAPTPTKSEIYGYEE